VSSNGGKAQFLEVRIREPNSRRGNCAFDKTSRNPENCPEEEEVPRKRFFDQDRGESRALSGELKASLARRFDQSEETRLGGRAPQPEAEEGRIYIWGDRRHTSRKCSPSKRDAKARKSKREN